MLSVYSVLSTPAYSKTTRQKKKPEHCHLFPLSSYSTRQMCKSQQSGKLENCSCFWPYRLNTHTHIPTLIISTSLFIFQWEAFAHFCAITGTVSVNTPQEFALGSLVSRQPAQLKLGSGTCPQIVLFPINQTPNRHPPMRADSGMQRDGPHPRFAQLC